MIIEWEGLQPDETRRWYRHCWGVRGTVWEVRGVFVREYFLVDGYMAEGLREHLPGAVLSIAHVIESELRAAVAAPVARDLSERWDALFVRALPRATP